MSTIQPLRFSDSSSIELDSKLGFPTGQDSATFWDKGTEVSSVSQDKGTTGQVQNFSMGRARSRQPVKIWEGTWEGTITVFPGTSP